MSIGWRDEKFVRPKLLAVVVLNDEQSPVISTHAT